MISERRAFAANKESVSGMMEFIDGLMVDFSAKTSYDIRLACEEILVNITSYAYPDGDGQLVIFWENDTGRRKLRIEFKDSGIPFNPLLIDKPKLDVPIAERKIGGLGIMMVRKLMDEVQYEYVEGENILTVFKEY